MTLSFSRKPRKSFFRRMFEWLLTILIAIIISLFIISNLATFTQVKEQSMEPTLIENDRVVVNKLGYFFNEPEKGDIVILNRQIEEKGILRNMIYEGKDIINNIKFKFTGEIEKNNLVKRIVGVKGDTINIENGNLFVNSKLVVEDYIKGSTPEKNGITYPIEVPEGQVFVLGDNRENSLDSRDFGLINIEKVKGKVIYRLLPFNRFGSIY
ncbi:MAG: signal peptidase I [Tissierellaceae bacterium]|nr:signal peptidase I [Tissierellaceae bacterium]